MEATEAFADFMLNLSLSQHLLQILGVRNTIPMPDFSVQLKTSALSGTPDSIRGITHRVYPPNSPTEIPEQ